MIRSSQRAGTAALSVVKCADSTFPIMVYLPTFPIRSRYIPYVDPMGSLTSCLRQVFLVYSERNYGKFMLNQPTSDFFGQHLAEE